MSSNKQLTTDEYVALNLLHEEDREIFDKCKNLAYDLSHAFELGLEVIEPKRRPIHGCAYGLCYVDDYKISILFRYKYRMGMWKTEPNYHLRGQWENKLARHPDGIVDTVIHEVAHLRYKNHGKDHKSFMAELKEWTEEHIL